MTRKADLMTQRNTGNERKRRICCPDRENSETMNCSCHMVAGISFAHECNVFRSRLFLYNG